LKYIGKTIICHLSGRFENCILQKKKSIKINVLCTKVFVVVEDLM